jgi:hypothetical protein
MGGKILGDIADSDGETKPRHIIASRVTEAINTLRGSGRKRKRNGDGPTKKKARLTTKRDIFFP